MAEPEIIESQILDEIFITRNCNIAIRIGNSRFNIYIRGDCVEISGDNTPINIEPRAANLIYITNIRN